jgi:UDP-N-acetyl-D-glucosamine dehydrogenase
MKDTATLRRRILNRTARIAVVGQGYVGLSLSCAAAEASFSVVGIDVDGARVSELSREILSVPGVGEEAFRSATATGRISFASDGAGIAECDIVVICVPTPVRDHAPDLTFVQDACATVAKHLKPGSLVVLESTTYPGTTEELLRPALESSGRVMGKDFLLAYSPERIDPGNEEFDFRSIPRVVGGLTPEATGAATLFYAQLVDKVMALSSTRAAELAKLLENTFRHVNIALVNEMAMLCHDMNIDVWEVIAAAESKPFGFMPFYPGPGVGGHCIPLDPEYLAWQVRRDAGRQFRVLEEAQDVNSQMPLYVATRVAEALNEVRKPVKDSEVLILGVAYKPDVGDMRESPALDVMKVLKKRGARVRFHDPYVPTCPLNGETLRRTELTQHALKSADVVVMITPHREYDLEWVAKHSRIIFDARNAFAEQRPENVVTL